MKPLDHFRRIWVLLSKRGACDAWGGAECSRVYNEWLRAGCPRPVETFIRVRANVGPRG